MSAGPTAGSPAPTGAGPLRTDDITAGWPMWARQLDALLTEVAAAQRAATVAHAEAYLAAEGTQQYRAASADLAAAAAVETHATLAGRAEAFRMVLAGQAGRDALTAGPGWLSGRTYAADDPANIQYHDPPSRP